MPRARLSSYLQGCHCPLRVQGSPTGDDPGPGARPELGDRSWRGSLPSSFPPRDPGRRAQTVAGIEFSEWPLTQLAARIGWCPAPPAGAPRPWPPGNKRPRRWEPPEDPQRVPRWSGQSVTERVALDPHSDLSERSAESIRVRTRTISLGSWGWSVLRPPRVFAGLERQGPCAFPPRRSHGIIACSSVLVRESPTLVVGTRGA